MLRLAQRVHPTPRLVEYLSLGLASKSSRTRIEAIEALAEILAAEGLAPFERAREKPFPVIAQACCSAFSAGTSSSPGTLSKPLSHAWLHP